MGEPGRPHPALAPRMRVSRMPGLGFALSLSLVGGAGPLMALATGLRARRLIRQGGGQVVGMKMAWRCIIAGAVGALAGPALIV